MKRLALAFLIGLACAAPVAAAPLYDNIDYTTGSGEGAAAAGPLADSFSTDVTSFSFGALKLRLNVAIEGDGGSSSISLLSDSAGAPGAVIAALGTILNNDLTSSFSVVSLSFAPITLDPGTRYWISLTGTGSVQWEFASSDSGVGVAGEFWSNSSGVFANDPIDTPYLMAIGPVGVPEPFTLSMLGAGLIGLTLLYRRKNKA